MAMFDRTFGVEIEALAQPSATFQSIADALTAAGVRAAAYAGSDWKVKRDGSLRGGNGMEIVSPPLAGEAGMEQVRVVCRVLKNAGFIVNNTCGLHVHVDARRISMASLRKLASDYASAESVIDSLMPPSRRGTANPYARSIATADKSAIVAARSASDLCRVLYGTTTYRRRRNQYDQRYVKLNFLNLVPSYFKGTVEFRQHSGTVEHEKVTAWVSFCLKMVDRAVENPVIGLGTPRHSFRGTPEAGRRATFVRLILRPEGVSREEIFAATGWARGSLSIKRFAAEAGVEVERRRGRYYGTLRGAVTDSSEPAADLTTLDALMTYVGATDDERAYWSRRRDRFAAALARAA